MKRIIRFICTLSLLFSLTACGNDRQAEQTPDYRIDTDAAASSYSTTESENLSSTSDSSGSETFTDDPAESGTASVTQPQNTAAPESKPNDQEEETEYMMNIQIGENLLTAALVNNSSAEALLEMLSDGPITINMRDYANMEKVGSLPESLPRNDEPLNTDAGDLILYQGSSFVIYYDTNSWSLTRLGKINNITKSELKNILGTGDVTITLSLPAEQ